MDKELIDHFEFFKKVLLGEIKLSNDRDQNIWTSWKVGGQEFYIYGVKQ